MYISIWSLILLCRVITCDATFSANRLCQPRVRPTPTPPGPRCPNPPPRTWGTWWTAHRSTRGTTPSRTVCVSVFVCLLSLFVFFVCLFVCLFLLSFSILFFLAFFLAFLLSCFLAFLLSCFLAFSLSFFLSFCVFVCVCF